MNAQKAREVAAWLRAVWPNLILDVVPVRVNITYRDKRDRPTRRRKGVDYEAYGARLTGVCRYAAGMKVCQDGSKKPGEEYTVTRFYLLGSLPPTYRYKIRSGPTWCQGVVYREPGSNYDWYVCGYWDSNGENRLKIPPETLAKSHPFGSNFTLGMWDHIELGQPIDHYDDGKRERAELIVTVLDDAVLAENADEAKT